MLSLKLLRSISLVLKNFIESSDFETYTYSDVVIEGQKRPMPSFRYWQKIFAHCSEMKNLTFRDIFRNWEFFALKALNPIVKDKC